MGHLAAQGVDHDRHHVALFPVREFNTGINWRTCHVTLHQHPCQSATPPCPCADFTVVVYAHPESRSDDRRHSVTGVTLSNGTPSAYRIDTPFDRWRPREPTVWNFRPSPCV